MGYYGLLMGLQYKNSRDLIRQFDEGTYNPDDAVTFKVPFDYPKEFDSEVFERVDGEFMKDGENYRLIKQRLFRDTFHIVYFKDKKANEINKAIEDYVKTFSDGSSDDDGSDTKILPNFIKEYYSKAISIQCITAGWDRSAQEHSAVCVFIDSYTPSIVHPPQRLS
jgi:hypothetical protein